MNLHDIVAAAWSRVRRKHGFPPLPPPRVEERGDTTAAIAMHHKQIILNAEFCERLSTTMPLDEVVEATLDHGVAHHTRCPWDFAMHLRLYAAAKAELYDRAMAQRATDTFIDVVADTFCVKEGDTALPRLYRHLERSPLDAIIAELYSCIWGVALESAAPERLIRRLSRLPYLDRRQWEQSLRRFCRLIRPILEEEQQREQGISSAPLGPHGVEGYSRDEVEQGLREFARQASSPREFRDIVADFGEELTEEGYIGGEEGMGMGKSKPLDTDALYYMKLAESYALPIYQAPRQKNDELHPYTHTPWEIGKPIQDVDVWTSFGKILPGITQTWLRQQGEGTGRREAVPDCVVVIDSSGSMTNPRYLLSYAILGAGCVCDAYLRQGAQVAVYNFSDAPAGNSLALDFTSDRKRLYRTCCRYFGGGTALALEEFDALLSKARRGAPDVFLITDMAIANLATLINYLSQIEGRITAVHLGENESALLFKEATASWEHVSVFPVRRTEDIPQIILGQVNAYLQPGPAGTLFD